jgi:hypothetical protein
VYGPIGLQRFCPLHSTGNASAYISPDASTDAITYAGTNYSAYITSTNAGPDVEPDWGPITTCAEHGRGRPPRHKPDRGLV